MIESTSNRHEIENVRFMLLVAMVFVASVGIMFLLFGIAYIKDLETLRNVPNLIWNFACGRPIESDVTLPLLLTISIVSFIVTTVLSGVRWWMGRDQRKKHES